MGASHVAVSDSALRKSVRIHKIQSGRFIKGDYATRMSGYAIARQSGWLSANDIRRLENMNEITPEEGGNLYLVNGNMVKLAGAGAAYGKDKGAGK